MDRFKWPPFTQKNTTYEAPYSHDARAMNIGGGGEYYYSHPNKNFSRPGHNYKKHNFSSGSNFYKPRGRGNGLGSVPSASSQGVANPSSDVVSLIVENKNLKHMIVLHVNLMQEQSDNLLENEKELEVQSKKITKLVSQNQELKDQNKKLEETIEDLRRQLRRHIKRSANVDDDDDHSLPPAPSAKLLCHVETQTQAKQALALVQEDQNVKEQQQRLVQFEETPQLMHEQQQHHQHLQSHPKMPKVLVTSVTDIPVAATATNACPSTGDSKIRGEFNGGKKTIFLSRVLQDSILTCNINVRNEHPDSEIISKTGNQEVVEEEIADELSIEANELHVVTDTIIGAQEEIVECDTIMEANDEVDISNITINNGHVEGDDVQNEVTITLDSEVHHLEPMIEHQHETSKQHEYYLGLGDAPKQLEHNSSIIGRAAKVIPTFSKLHLDSVLVSSTAKAIDVNSKELITPSAHSTPNHQKKLQQEHQHLDTLLQEINDVKSQIIENVDHLQLQTDHQGKKGGKESMDRCIENIEKHGSFSTTDTQDAAVGKVPEVADLEAVELCIEDSIVTEGMVTVKEIHTNIKTTQIEPRAPSPSPPKSISTVMDPAIASVIVSKTPTKPQPKNKITQKIQKAVPQIQVTQNQGAYYQAVKPTNVQGDNIIPDFGTEQLSSKPVNAIAQTGSPKTVTATITTLKALNQSRPNEKNILHKNPPQQHELLNIEEQTKQKLHKHIHKQIQLQQMTKPITKKDFQKDNSTLIFPPKSITMIPTSITPAPTPTTTPSSTPQPTLTPSASPQTKPETTVTKAKLATENKLSIQTPLTPQSISSVSSSSSSNIRTVNNCTPHAQLKSKPSSKFLSSILLYSTRSWEDKEFHCDYEFFLEEADELLSDNPALEIPKWKVIRIQPSTDNKDIENLNDEEFIQRHDKYVRDEIDRKKRDARYIRDQIRSEELRKRHNQDEVLVPLDPLPMSTFYPLAEDVDRINYVSEVPVQAFGENVVNLQENSDFALPWLESANAKTSTAASEAQAAPVATLASNKLPTTAAEANHQEMNSSFVFLKRRKRQRRQR